MRALFVALAVFFSTFSFAEEGAAPRSGKILLVGDSHMAGTLGDSLVAKLGGQGTARRYGIVGASAVATYATNIPVPGICPHGCEQVCPAGAACPFVQGYRRADDPRAENGRVPASFPRLSGLIERERAGLGAVLVALGTNDAAKFSCSESAVRGMQSLLRQASLPGQRCIFVGPPSYVDGPVIRSCGSVKAYGDFVARLLGAAQALGCVAIDSRQVRDAHGQPVLCRAGGGVHCTSSQAALWADFVKRRIP